VNGTKHDAEGAGLRKQAVGERRAIGRRGTVTGPGRGASDHAGAFGRGLVDPKSTVKTVSIWALAQFDERAPG
jgi:hypothetical protein